MAKGGLEVATWIGMAAPPDRLKRLVANEHVNGHIR
jgi:hypothetical protein